MHQTSESTLAVLFSLKTIEVLPEWGCNPFLSNFIRIISLASPQSCHTASMLTLGVNGPLTPPKITLTFSWTSCKSTLSTSSGLFGISLTGAPTSKGGRQSISQPKFPKNCMKTKKLGRERNSVYLRPTLPKSVYIQVLYNICL